MIDHGRKRRGGFGSVQRVALTAAFAILAVSPAVVPMTDFHLDGVGPAIAEAVFGEPVYAQEPPCDPPTPCVEAAEQKYRECIDRNPWYRDALCWLARLFDLLACTMDLVVH
ncbi:MAG: hypothetical protein F4123_09335 [Gemmatimonadetes bacterium]|nr:hypothetical protein [Gemmatimonadota bacterium]MYB97598.1 hypothetical protein [Gemmatimonadota bacterium]MYI46558.1 hypothetical protein [Gemmatimonadota bacterium]